MTFYMASKHRLVIYVLKYKSQFIVSIAVEVLQPETEIFHAMIHVF
jgi:hypothetical protein